MIGVGDTDHFLAADQEGGERVRGVPQERDWTKQAITIFLSILLVTAMILIIRYIKPSNPDISNETNDEPFTNHEQVRLLSGKQDRVVFFLGSHIMCRSHTKRCRFLHRLPTPALVMSYEWKKYMKYIMIVQVVGLATVGGLIYLDAGKISTSPFMWNFTGYASLMVVIYCVLSHIERIRHKRKGISREDCFRLLAMCFLERKHSLWINCDLSL